MMNISHDEFVLIYNVLKEYYDMKEKSIFLKFTLPSFRNYKLARWNKNTNGKKN